MARLNRSELIHILGDPWKRLVKPFLMESPMSSSVIAGHADISASAIRSLRNGNRSPNSKQLAILLKFVIKQEGIK